MQISTPQKSKISDPTISVHTNSEKIAPTSVKSPQKHSTPEKVPIKEEKVDPTTPRVKEDPKERKYLRSSSKYSQKVSKLSHNEKMEYISKNMRFGTNIWAKAFKPKRDKDFLQQEAS